VSLPTSLRPSTAWIASLLKFPGNDLMAVTGQGMVSTDPSMCQTLDAVVCLGVLQLVAEECNVSTWLKADTLVVV
jgi:hypothetical protein